MSLDLKISIEDVSDKVRAAFYGARAIADPSMFFQITKAATLTIREAGALLKKEGRESIKAGGLGVKMANAWRVNVYPSKGFSLAAAAYGFHRSDYAAIFETGGAISGKRGLLWIPFPTVPRIGRRVATAKQIGTAGVDLFSIQSKRSGRPVLAAKIRKTGANRNASIRGAVSLAALRAGTNIEKIRETAKRRGKAKGGVKVADAKAAMVTVPLFFGISRVTMRKRMDTAGVARSITNRLPAIYDSKLTT